MLLFPLTLISRMHVNLQPEPRHGWGYRTHHVDVAGTARQGVEGHGGRSQCTGAVLFSWWQLPATQRRAAGTDTANPATSGPRSMKRRKLQCEHHAWSFIAVNEIVEQGQGFQGPVKACMHVVSVDEIQFYGCEIRYR